MIITYFGKEFFRLQQGEMTLAFNPISKEAKGGAVTHFGADIALITTNHPDYNGLDQLSHGERVPFAITGPGDYEIKEIFIKGMPGGAVELGKKYLNSIYTLGIEGINIAFLGALGESDLGKEAREAIEAPDILFVPVGGKGLLDAKSSAKLVSTLEPKIIIPMDYDESSLKAFLKELGEEKAETTEKLTLKRKDLEGKEGEVVILKPA